MPLLPQDLVHKMEVGVGARAVRVTLAVLAVLALFVAYNIRCFRNFSTEEAMDQAQLARNISEGRGYTTRFVRPFSMFLIKRANQERLESLSPEQRADLCQVKGPHPDISNPPVYPVMLAGLMKAAPILFDRDTTRERSFWWRDGAFMRAQSDFVISLFNQFLLLLLVWITFHLARRLFDSHVAWLSAGLLFCTELLWKFSASGLSTMLLLVLFMGLVWALVRLEAAARETTASSATMVRLAAVIGALVGIGMLTRYACGFLLLPALGFVVLFAGRWRVTSALVVTGVFALIVTPWIIRNIHVCGMPFGTAGYAALENSAYFPAHQLERSLNPNLSQFSLTPLWWKFFGNLRSIALNDLMRLGGSWISAFFLAGLMLGFRNPAISRLRYFALASLGVLVMVQAFGRTSISDDSPEINGENLIVLLLPLVLIYGVSFFHALLDQMTLPFLWARRVVIGAFSVLITLPLIFSFLPPKVVPIAFPPYYPPDIQKVANWMGENELVMSDMPWAMAWYGDRQSVWLTYQVRGDFFQLTDYIKPVRGLYLTPVTLDAKLMTQLAARGGDSNWGEVIIPALTRDKLPQWFPLTRALPLHTLPGQLFLSDWERWLKTTDAPARP